MASKAVGLQELRKLVQLKDKALEMLQEEVMHLQVPGRRETENAKGVCWLFLRQQKHRVNKNQERDSCWIMLEYFFRSYWAEDDYIDFDGESKD